MAIELTCPIREKGLCVAVVRVTEQVKGLTGWQKSQNGELEHIKQELTALREHTTEKLTELRDSMNESANRLQWWLIALLASIVVTMLLLAANLALKTF